MTLADIERKVCSVFPAAQLWVAGDSRTHASPDEAEPGRYVDDLEDFLDEEFDDETPSVLIVAVLGVVERCDVRSEPAFVPVDYEHRYGGPSWSGEDAQSVDEVYAPLPIDWVPMDDRINVDWAEQRVGESFPNAEFEELEGGQGLALYIRAADRGSRPDGATLFDVSVTFEEPEDFEDGRHGATVWELEEERNQRRRRAKAALAGLDPEISLSDRLAAIATQYELADNLQEAEALWEASKLLRLPSQMPVLDAIKAGESEFVELKVTARSQFGTGERSEEAEFNLIRTVAAFMNSRDGGILLVGVNDSGKPLGIEWDLVRVKGSVDKLRLSVTQSLEGALGRVAVSLCVTTSFSTLEGHTVLALRVLPSWVPVLARRGDSEFFFVRSGPSTKSLLTSETMAYIEQRWGKAAS